MSHSEASTGKRPTIRTLIGSSVATLGVLCSAVASPGAAAQGASSAAESVATGLGAEYGREQMRRLANSSDRDSLIAAALIGLTNDGQSAPAEGHADVVYRLVGDYSNDPLAVFTAALVCNVQLQPCARTDDQLQLLRIAPDNAIHHVLLPNAGKPSAEQLHRAAAAGTADSHYSALLGIVRKALANQAAPQGQTQGVDPTELALALRRNELASVPWPMFGPIMTICSPAAAARREGDASVRADCANLGLALFSDLGHNIVTRTYGGTLVRRFAKGTPAEVAANAFRRQYVWIDELPGPATSADKERLYEETVSLGEWEAFQRHAERSSGARAAPADWAPSNPQALLLPEERGAASSRK